MDTEYKELPTNELSNKISELEYEELMILDRLEELKKERQLVESEIISRGNFK